MITACIVLLYISYAIPVACLLIKGRNNIRHGPFWLGPIGLFANCVLLFWTLFTLIMYSFPPVQPVKASSKSRLLCLVFNPGMDRLTRLIIDMNYVSVVYFIVAVIMAVDWVVRGKKNYRGQQARREQALHLGGGCGDVTVR